MANPISYAGTSLLNALKICIRSEKAATVGMADQTGLHARFFTAVEMTRPVD